MKRSIIYTALVFGIFGTGLLNPAWAGTVSGSGWTALTNEGPALTSYVGANYFVAWKGFSGNKSFFRQRRPSRSLLQKAAQQNASQCNAVSRFCGLRSTEIGFECQEPPSIGARVLQNASKCKVAPPPSSQMNYAKLASIVVEPSVIGVAHKPAAQQNATECNIVSRVAGCEETSSRSSRNFPVRVLAKLCSTEIGFECHEQPQSAQSTKRMQQNATRFTIQHASKDIRATISQAATHHQ